MNKSCLCEDTFDYHDLVDCIATALDARDPYTGNHSLRVSDMACMLCRRMELGKDETQMIHIAAHLHDIGKIGIPDAVLLKPTRLNEYEWSVMKSHPRIGADILSKSPHFAEISRVILHHHERYNGGGYPDGISGEDIPLGSRIIAVCDSLDAMASARAYRSAMPLGFCRAEIEKNSGQMYDPMIVCAALDIWDELTEAYRG